MRSLIVTEFLSLDGVMEDPAWTGPYWNDEIAKFKTDETTNSDALLLVASRTRDLEQSATEPGSWGSVLQRVRKYVVSTTLDSTEWNDSALIKHDIVQAITNLKQQSGQAITVTAVRHWCRRSCQHGLVDRYHLLVYPVVVGSRQASVRRGCAATSRLVESQRPAPASWRSFMNRIATEQRRRRGNRAHTCAAGHEVRAMRLARARRLGRARANRRVRSERLSLDQPISTRIAALASASPSLGAAAPGSSPYSVGVPTSLRDSAA